MQVMHLFGSHAAGPGCEERQFRFSGVPVTLSRPEGTSGEGRLLRTCPLRPFRRHRSVTEGRALSPEMHVFGSL